MPLKLNAAYHQCSPLYCDMQAGRHYTPVLAHPTLEAQDILRKARRQWGLSATAFLKEAPEATFAVFAHQMPYADPRNTRCWILIDDAILVQETPR